MKVDTTKNVLKKIGLVLSMQTLIYLILFIILPRVVFGSQTFYCAVYH